jgi:uncharacterized protein involved in response to NO
MYMLNARMLNVRMLNPRSSVHALAVGAAGGMLAARVQMAAPVDP